MEGGLKEPSSDSPCLSRPYHWRVGEGGKQGRRPTFDMSGQLGCKLGSVLLRLLLSLCEGIPAG